MNRHERDPGKCVRAWAISIIAILASAPAFATAFAAAPSTDSTRAFGQAMGTILSGNGNVAAEKLHSIDGATLPEIAARARDCMLSRLEGNAREPTPTNLAESAIAAYQAYWREDAMDPSHDGSARVRRDRQLATLLGLADSQDGQHINAELGTALRRAGYFVKLGRTPPFDELILWREQEMRTFDVALPERHHPTRVAIMHGVTGKGWSDYLTCGLAGTGGWADRGVIHVIPDHFPDGLDDNGFVASLLTHESQHMADYEDFDGLPSWRLEYRSKLAEVWSSDEANVQRLLATFSMIQSDNPELPHPYANREVMAALEARIGAAFVSASMDRLRETARILLVEDSAWSP